MTFLQVAALVAASVIGAIGWGIIIGQNFFPGIKRELNNLIDKIDGKADQRA